MGVFVDSSGQDAIEYIALSFVVLLVAAASLTILRDFVTRKKVTIVNNYSD